MLHTYAEALDMYREWSSEHPSQDDLPESLDGLDDIAQSDACCDLANQLERLVGDLPDHAERRVLELVDALNRCA